MEFGKQLAKYREENHIDQKDIAKLLDITPQTVSNYETGKNKIPYEKLIMLCNYYKKNPLDFIKADLNFDLEETKQHEQKILSAYKNLTDSDRRVVDFIFKTSKREKIKPIIKYESIVTDDIKALPLVEQKASAGIGDPTHQWSNESDKVCFPKNVVPEGVTHAIIVDGFSMEPTFFNGQIVFINAEKECNDGDFGIFQVITPEKTDIYCKQLKYDEFGRRYLHSVSERADDPEFTEDEDTILECIGKIIVL